MEKKEDALTNFVRYLVQKGFAVDKKPKRCPVCQDGACETKSEECGQ